MSGAAAVAAIDWGTTRLRLWLLDAAGNMLAERRADDGLITAQAAGFPATMERHLAAIGAPADLPVIICGMAGSRQGWMEAPYVETPAPLEAILGGALRIADERRDIRIVPGLCQKLEQAPDVMRGEETQLAGAGLPAKGRHVVCMPGTHSKWVTVEDGTVTGFGTWPTGELFSLLATQSILRHSLGVESKPVSPDSIAFRSGSEMALSGDGDISSKLFGIRASSLLFGMTQEDAAATLSGLLIGGEIASAGIRYDAADAPIALVVSGAIGALYEKALTIAGHDVRVIDAEEAVRKGLFEAARHNGLVAKNGIAA